MRRGDFGLCESDDRADAKRLNLLAKCGRHVWVD
jgi:hypothetical protein